MNTEKAKIALKLGELEFDLEMELPVEPVKVQTMLPVFRSLTNGLVDIAIDASTEVGKPISCKKGCGACCRMAIPISEPEAYRLRQVIEDMPEPRQSVIRKRFEDGMRTFAGDPSLEYMFQRPNGPKEEERNIRALDAYYEKRIPCPFLEEESCSIYEERPLICRQFVVTSPAAFCERVDGKGVERVPLLARPSDALILTATDPAQEHVASMPMIVLLEWTDKNPDTAPERTGAEWMATFTKHLQGKASNAKNVESAKSSKPPLDMQAILTRAFPGGPAELGQRIPQAPAKPQAMLPALREFTNALVQISEEAVIGQGLQISCAKGCAACCRQVVPITVPEAYDMRRMVEALPEPRQSVIRERFEQGMERLRASGAVDGILNASGTDRDEIARVGKEYLAQNVACPFLEKEACSIHPDRPLACREFLVTSPAVNCSDPRPDNIIRVPMASAPSRALMLAAPGDRAGKLPLIPLIAAMDWTDAHPDNLLEKPGGQWLNEFVKQLQHLAKS